MADGTDQDRPAADAADYTPPAIESRLPVHDPLLGNIVTAASGGGGGA